MCRVVSSFGNSAFRVHGCMANGGSLYSVCGIILIGSNVCSQTIGFAPLDNTGNGIKLFLCRMFLCGNDELVHCENTVNFIFALRLVVLAIGFCGRRKECFLLILPRFTQIVLDVASWT